MRRIVSLAALLVGLFAASAPAQDARANDVDAILPLLDEQTVCVIQVNVEQVDLAAIKGFVQMALDQAKVDAADLNVQQTMQMLEERRAAFTGADIKHIFVIASIADFMSPPPPAGGDAAQRAPDRNDNLPLVLVAVPYGDGADVAKVNAALAKLFDVKKDDIVRIGNAAVAGHAPGIARAQRQLNAKPAPVTASVRDALATGQKNDVVRIALVPSDDVRSAAEFLIQSEGALKGTQWASLTASAPPKPSLTLTVETSDNTSAERVAGALKQMRDMVAGNEQFKRDMPKIAGAFAQHHPRVEGTQVILQTDEAFQTAVLEDSALVLIQARHTAKRTASMNNMRQILQGAHVYAFDHQGTFPPDLQNLAKHAKLPPQVLVNPRFPERREAYVYINLGLSKGKAGEDVMLYEAQDLPEDTILVGFADGHVARHTSEEFKTLLAATQAKLAEQEPENVKPSQPQQ